MGCDKGKGFQGGEELEGRYANAFNVGQNAFEFVIDFGQSYVEGKREIFHTRIVSSPFYANVLLKTLQDASKLKVGLARLTGLMSRLLIDRQRSHGSNYSYMPFP